MFKQFIISLVFFISSLIFFLSVNPALAEDGTYNGSSNYEVGQYRTYNTRRYPDFDDKFYVSSMKSIIEEGGGPGKYDEIRAELALTGYQAYCMQEKVRIEPQYSTNGLITRFLELYPEGINLRAFSKEILGTQNARYPIWRDLEGKQFLMNSLEEYFGFKDVYEVDAAKSEVNSGAINSLLSQKQACVQAWKTMGAERRNCNKLENPDTCEFTKRRIPGTAYEVHDLMTLMNIFTDGNWAGGDEKRGEELAIKWCSVIFSEPQNPEESTLSETQKGVLKKLKATIINAPTYMDKGYRFGFIVAVIETRQPGNQAIDDFFTENEEESTRIWNFFTKKTQNIPWDEVLVVAFKLPDIGTNKGGSPALEKWNDPLDLTRIVLSNEEEQDLHDEEAQKVRSDTLAGAISASNQTPDSRIFCFSGDFPNGNGTKTCQIPLPKALTDFVNSKIVDCETVVEPVNEISDLAGLRDASDTYGKLFKQDNGGQILLNLFLDSQYNTGGTTPDYAAIRPDRPAIKTIWTIFEENWPPTGRDSYAHFYLVYPVGYELSTIEAEIAGAFFNKEQIATMSADPSIINNFEVTGQTQILDGGKVNWKFEDYEKTANWECGPLIDKFTGLIIGPKPCMEYPSIGIKQDGAKLDVLGGRLGWWMRKVQVALSSKASFAHSYYESCKTMEEFLLGKCAGAGQGGGQNNCVDVAIFKTEIDSAIDKAASKWGSLFPVIGTSQLAQMMREIYAIEGKIDVDSGAADWCTPNSVTATGPFGIKHETYKIVTNGCPDEWQDDGLDQCDNEILNRCEAEDAAELAIRIILFSGGAWRYGEGLYCGGSISDRSAALTNFKDLYRAVCSYGEGDTLLPHLGDKKYSDYIFEKMGWEIPPEYVGESCLEIR